MPQRRLLALLRLKTRDVLLQGRLLGREFGERSLRLLIERCGFLVFLPGTPDAPRANMTSNKHREARIAATKASSGHSVASSPYTGIIVPLSSKRPNMSFLFHKRTKKILNVVWGVVAVLVILGMIIFFAPGLTNCSTQ